jgi:hypothetical protein
MLKYRDKAVLARRAQRQSPATGVLGLGLLMILCVTAHAQGQPSSGTWKFAVSGDSRNCGDVVMPAIAKSVRQDGAAFYWHLGDYRLISNFDEDYRQIHPKVTVSDYLANAWPDFIQHQLNAFGELPVFLEIGNHELSWPMTRPLYLAQFADWLDQPVLKRQRLADNPNDHMLKAYYHWIDRGVDFIGMDNSSSDMVDATQMKWFQAVLARDAKDPSVRSVVLGMHDSLPDGLSAGHSANDSPQQEASGRVMYAQLLAFRNSTKKNVYILASHSHFVLNNVYDTACRSKADVLPGWIMGSAGAVRYRLPKDYTAATVAMTDVYGYLLGTVAPDGSITFDFKMVNESDVPDSVTTEFSPDFVKWCFTENKSSYQPAGATCPKSPPASGQ